MSSYRDLYFVSCWIIIDRRNKIYWKGSSRLPKVKLFSLQHYSFRFNSGIMWKVNTNPDFLVKSKKNKRKKKSKIMNHVIRIWYRQGNKFYIFCTSSLSEFTEQSYTKLGSKIERKIFALHKSGNVDNKKIRGMSEGEAKMAYIKLARSLQTFGTTFFLVKVD